MRLAYELWPALHEVIGAPTHYERIGHLLLYEREQDLLAAPAMAWTQEQQGIASAVLTRAELLAMEPHVSGAIRGAVFCPHDGVADHPATTRGYAEAARRHGARIDEHTKVVGLDLAGGRIAAVRTEQGERIAARRALCLLANGGETDLLGRCLGLRSPVWSSAFQVLITSPLHSIPIRHLIGHASRRLAMKRHGADRIMISGGWPGRWSAASGRGETSVEAVAGNLAEAVHVYPGLAGIGIAEADAGHLEASCIDGVPIIGPVPGVENLTVVTGASGHGWAIAPAVVELLAEWLLRGKRPALLAPFGYERFLPASTAGDPS
jgi:sarcosine oxidase subunit beta